MRREKSQREESFKYILLVEAGVGLEVAVPASYGEGSSRLGGLAEVEGQA